MAYASPADIRETVAPDGNFAGTCAEFTDDQMSKHILRAQSLVDSSVGMAYTDSNEPPLLKGLVVALGAYYATLAYRKSKDLSQYDPIVLLYQDAQATLKGISNGTISPTEPGTDTSVVPAVVQPKVINPLLYGAAAFVGDDFGLGFEFGPSSLDPIHLSPDPALEQNP
jgi:hypothetical protein